MSPNPNTDEVHVNIYCENTALSNTLTVALH